MEAFKENMLSHQANDKFFVQNIYVMNILRLDN